VGLNLTMKNNWNLSDLQSVSKNGFKVFSCFHCGGGSTMGYKLAGYEVLGGVEIDPVMMNLYKHNHNPKHSYLMGVEDFNKIPDDQLPEDLFSLDILDGSPPCSSFSASGSREKKWNKETKFREGQAVQILDNLFFHFIDTAKKLKPKIVVAENVKGIIYGNAKGYVKQIFTEFREAGYECQLFLLNASRMGVPQKRERTVFIARRIDLEIRKIKLEFNEPIVSVNDATLHLDRESYDISLSLKNAEDILAWKWCIKNNNPFFCQYYESEEGGSKRKKFNYQISFSDYACYTITSSIQRPISDKHARYFTDEEIVACQTFPQDYNFLKCDPGYVCGMSVPPFMMQRIATKIEQQLLSKQV